MKRYTFGSYRPLPGAVRTAIRTALRICGICALTLSLNTCDLFKVGLGDKVDINPPSVSVRSHKSGDYVGGTLVLSGAATDDSGVKSVTVSVQVGSGTPVVSDATVSNGTWTRAIDTTTFAPNNTASPTAAQGEQADILVTCTDLSGKTTTTPVTLYFDNTPPVLWLQSPTVDELAPAAGPNQRILSKTVRFQGGAKDFAGSQVKVSLVPAVGGVVTPAITVSGNIAWSVDVDTTLLSLVPKDATFTFVAADPAGNKATIPAAVHIDQNEDAPYFVIPSLGVDQRPGGTPGGGALTFAPGESIAITVEDSDGVDKNSVAVTLVPTPPSAGILTYSRTNRTSPTTGLPLSVDFAYTFSDLLANLPLGAYSFEITGSDALAGKPNPAVGVATRALTVANTQAPAIVVDKGPPDLTVTSPVNGSSAKTLTVAGTASDGYDVQSVSVRLNNGAWTLATLGTAVGGVYPWTDTPTGLPDGAYNVDVQALDKGGTLSLIKTIAVTLDNTAPAVGFATVSPLVGASTVNGVISFTATASDVNGLSDVRWWILPAAQAAPAWADAGSTSFPSPPYIANVDTTALAGGAYKIWVSARDQAGNEGSASYSVTVDQASDLPAITLTNMNAAASTSGQAGLNLQETNAKLTGSIADDDSVDASTIEISIDSASAFIAVTTPGTDGRSDGFEHNLGSLSEGPHYFSLRAGDLLSAKAGKPVVTTVLGPVYFIIDRSPPDLSVTSPASGSAHGTGFTIDGSSGDANGVSKVEVSTNGGSTWSTLATAAGSWSYPASADPGHADDGLHALQFRATDSVGKTTTIPFSYTVDTRAPTFAVVAPAASAWLSGATATASGTAADAGVGVSRVQWSTASNAGPWTDASGADSWTALLDLAALGEGQHTLYVRALDLAGNTSSVAEIEAGKRAFGIDQNDPLASETGIGSPVGFRGALFDLSGTASDTNALAHILVTEKKDLNPATTVLDQAISGTSQSWSRTSLPSAGLLDGTYLYTITVTDVAGRTSAVLTRTITIDRTPPTVSVTAPGASEWLAGAAYTVRGTGSDGTGVGVQEVRYYIGASAPADPSTWSLAGGTNNWNATLDMDTDGAGPDAGLAEGQYTLHVSARDTAGNWMVTAVTVSFGVDQASPGLGGFSMPAGVNYRIAAFSLDGTAADTNALAALSVTQSRDGGAPVILPPPAVSGTSQAWSLTGLPRSAADPSVTLVTDGVYEYVITVTDVAGKQTQVTRTVTVDTAAPAVGFVSVSPIVGTQTVNGIISFTVSASDANGLSGVKWWILPATDPAPGWTTLGATSFAFAPYTAIKDTRSLSDGSYTLWVMAHDQAGNEGSASFALGVDQTSDLPAASLTNMDASAVTAGQAALNLQENNAKLTGTITDDDSVDASTIEISIDGLAYGAVTSRGPSGRSVGFEHTLSSLAEGVHYFTLSASDLASAKSGVPVSQTTIGPAYFVIDRNAPTLSVTSPAQNAVRRTDFTINGTASDVNGLKDRDTNGTPEIEVSEDGGVTWVLRDAPAGAWSYNVTGLFGGIQDGTHTFRIRATDIFGKETVATYAFMVDTLGPTPAVTSPAADNQLVTGSATSLSGTASDGSGSGIASVEYSVDAGATWALANGTGSWTANIDLTAMPEGANTLLVRATDLAGNVTGVAVQRIFLLDRTPPTASETGLGPSVVYRNAAFSLVVAAADSLGLGSITITESKNGAAAVTVVNAAPLSGTSATYTLPRGVNAGTHADDATYVYEITVLDSAGRSAPALLRTVTVDTVAPAVAMNAPVPSIMDGSLLVNGTVTLSGTVDENSLDSVDYRVGAGAFIAVTSNKAAPRFTVDTTTLADLTTTVVTVRATDKAGNIATQTVDLNVDQSSDRPRILTTNLTLGGPNPLGRNPAILFTVEDDDSVDASMIQYSLNGGTTWSDLSFPSTTDGSFLQAKTTLLGQLEGAGTIRIRAMDVNAGASWAIYGNVSNNSWTETPDVPFFVDYGPPTTILASPAATTVFKDDILVSGTTQDSMGVPSANIAIEIGGVTYTSSSSPAIAIVQGTGASDPVTFTLSVPISGLSDGNYNLQVRTTDGSGTTGTLDRPIGVDKTAPTNAFISPEPASTINGTITIQGQVSDNRAIQQVYLWEGPFASTPPADVTTWTHVGSNLLWSYSLNTTTPVVLSGAHKVVVVTEDAAGNRSSYYTLPFTIDQTTDKPVIELTTLNAAGTFTENLLPTTLQVAGTVSDDDGVDRTRMQVAVDLNRDGNYGGMPGSIAGEQWTTVSNPPASNGRVVTWSHVFSGLTDGQYELHARAADIYDSGWDTYSSTLAGPVHFSVDTANPTGAVTSPAQGVYTSSAATTIQGTAFDASGVQKVELNFGTVPNLVATSDGYASWSYTHTAAGDGQVSFQVIVTDTYGKVSTIDRYYIVDTTPPSAIIDTPSTNPDTASGAYNGDVTFRGTAADSVKVDKVYYRFSATAPAAPDGAFTGWTQAASTYNWTAGLDTRTINNTGADLAYYFGAVSVDSSGNRSAVQSLAFTVNQASDRPGLTLSAPTPAQVFGTSAKALGAVNDDDGLASIEVRIDLNNDGDFGDGGVESYAPVSVPAVVSGKSLNFENTLAALADGVYKLQVRVRDVGYAAAPPAEQQFHETESAALAFSIDTLPPSLAITSIDVLARYIGDPNRVYTDNFGGRYLNNDSTFTVSASDASGISAVEFSTDGTTWSAAIPAGGSTYTYGLTINVITHSFDGTRNLQYRATDGNGKVSTGLVTVIIDTEEPVVGFTSPAGMTLADPPNVNGDVIIQGTVTDGSAVTGVTITAGIDSLPTSPLSLMNTGNNLSWKVTLANSSTRANATYATDQGGNVWRLPVKVTATELAGNRTIETGYVDIDPNSDNPVVSVVSPAPGDSVAGVFLVNGTVVDDDGAQGVRIQVDLNNDGVYGANGPFNGTLDLNGDTNTTGDFETETAYKTITVTNGAWSILMNGSGELNKSNLILRGLAGASGTIGFKVTPVDIYGTVGAPQTQTVYIDSESPIIKGLLADGVTETASPTPASGSLQKGSLTLRALFRDDKDLLSSSMQVSFDGGANFQGISSVPGAIITDAGTTNPYTYRITIPVNTATVVPGGNGTLQISLKVTDRTYKQVTQLVSYNVDNTLPQVAWNDPQTLSFQGSVPDEIYSFLGSGSTMNNEAFGKASDSGTISGIQKIAVYFVKGGNLLYNPKTGAGTAVTSSVSGDELYDQSGSLAIGVPFTTDPTYLITIDKRTELGQFDTNPTLGDQDGFNESLKAKSGYDEWFAYFDSTQLPDGPIDVYYVAYDEAGNKVYGRANGQVTNNPPSITSFSESGVPLTGSPAKVKTAGTFTFDTNSVDLGSNAGIVASTWKLTVSHRYGAQGGGDVDLGNEKALAQFYYGANAGGSWIRDYSSRGSGTPASATLSINTLTDGFQEGDWYRLDAEVKDNDGNTAARSFYLKVNNSDSTPPAVTIDNFTQTSVGIWTSGQGPLSFDIAAASINTGTDTVTATLPAWITNGTRVMFAGSTAPGGLTTATPCYIYNGTGTTFQLSAAAGIGPALDITSASGTYDLVSGGHVEDAADSLYDGADADLSGAVLVTGTASDGTDVSSLTVEISSDGGASYTPFGAILANRAGDSVLGYSYTWSFLWDTARQGMTPVARANVIVRAYGTDPASNSLLAGSRPTKGADVAPYVTSITDPTGLSADVLRGAAGKYSISSHATNTLTVRGYNFGSGGFPPLAYLSPTAANPLGGSSTTTTRNSYNEILVSKNATRSGWMSVMVNTVPSVNNLDRNDRSRNIETNADPRSQQWTDDRFLWVWTVTQLNGTAFTNKTYYYPDLIMSVNQPLFSFTDDNGGDTNRTTSDTAVTQRSGNRFQRQASTAVGNGTTFILTGQDTTQSGDNMGYLELTGYADATAPSAGNNSLNWIRLQGSDFPAHVAVGANSSILRKTNRFPYPKIIAETSTTPAGAANIYTTYYDASPYYQSLNYVSFRATAATTGNFAGMPGNDNARMATVTPIPGTVGRASPYFDMVRIGATGIAVAYYDVLSQSLKMAYSATAFGSTGAAGSDRLPNATGQEKATYTFTSDTIGNYVGKYFTINSGTTAATSYDVWFDTTGAAAKPAGSGAVNNIRVNVSPAVFPTFNRTYASIGVVNALRGVAAFADSEMGATATVTQPTAVVVSGTGNVTDAAVGNLAGAPAVAAAPTWVQGGAANWSIISIDSSASVGQHVSITTDGTKIYIAYYDYDDANLKLARVTWGGGSPSVDGMVFIDTYLSAGTWTDIQLITDSQLTGQANAQPFISYYADSYTGTKKPVRIAFPTFDASAGVNLATHGVTGAGASDNYTGSWDVITVPAASVPRGGMEQFSHVMSNTYVGGALNLPVVAWMGDYIEYAKLQPYN